MGGWFWWWGNFGSRRRLLRTNCRTAPQRTARTSVLPCLRSNPQPKVYRMHYTSRREGREESKGLGGEEGQIYWDTLACLGEGENGAYKGVKSGSMWDKNSNAREDWQDTKLSSGKLKACIAEREALLTAQKDQAFNMENARLDSCNIIKELNTVLDDIKDRLKSLKSSYCTQKDVLRVCKLLENG